jgi:hypothetical protein
MNIYKYTKKDNDEILLERVDLDLNDYEIIELLNGNKILRKKSIIINNIRDLGNYNFSASTISDCYINDTKVEKLKYKSILDSIYLLINKGSTIIKNSILNIETIKKADEGFYYIESLGISIQGVDANKCLREILIQTEKNKIKLEITLKTISNDNIKIQIN